MQLVKMYEISWNTLQEEQLKYHMKMVTKTAWEAELPHVAHKI